MYARKHPFCVVIISVNKTGTCVGFRVEHTSSHCWTVGKCASFNPGCGTNGKFADNEYIVLGSCTQALSFQISSGKLSVVGQGRCVIASSLADGENANFRNLGIGSCSDSNVITGVHFNAAKNMLLWSKGVLLNRVRCFRLSFNITFILLQSKHRPFAFHFLSPTSFSSYMQYVSATMMCCF